MNSAVELLAEYNLRLSEELEKRRKVAAMLRDFAQAQRDLAKQAEARLEVIIFFLIIISTIAAFPASSLKKKILRRRQATPLLGKR